MIPERDEVYFGDTVAIYAIGMTVDDGEQSMPGSTPVTYTDMTQKGSFIVGSDTIPYQATVPYSIARSGGVNYYACGITPQVWIDVSRPSTYAGSGATWLTEVLPCPVILLARDTIAPGDTVAMSIMGHTRDTTLINYPEDQEFEIWMNIGEDYGWLRSIVTGYEDYDLYGQQPFEFIAANSIDADSVLVELEVWVNSGGIASLIKDGAKDTLHLPTGSMLKKKVPVNRKGISVPTLSEVRESIARHSFEKLKKRLCVIREKSKNKTQFDRIIAKMEARLLCNNGVIEDNIATHTLSAKTGQIAMRIEEDGESCDPTKKFVIKKQIPASLILRFSKTNVLHNESCCASVEVRDKDKKPYSIPPDTKFNFFSFTRRTILWFFSSQPW